MIEVNFINGKQATKILGVSYVTLNKLVRDGKLRKYEADGLRPMYNETEVKELWTKIYK